MNGFSGNYTHSAGDHFIFKGGVTWPNSCFQMTITSSGVSGNPDYYGVSSTYFAGSAWTRPIFNGGGSAAPLHRFVAVQGDYVTIDNIEFTNQYWNSGTGGYGTSCINVWPQVYVTIEKCLFHNWTHDTAANGCNDDLICVLAGGADELMTGCVVNNCTFDGTLSSDSGMATYFWPVVTNSSVINMSNGFLVGCNSATPVRVGYCNISFIQGSFSGVHENAIESTGAAEPGQVVTIDHCVMHDITAGATVLIPGGPGGSNQICYIYDCVVWNSAPPPIDIDTRYGVTSAAYYLWNNTIDNTGSIDACIRVLNSGNPLNYLQVENNQLIGNNAYDYSGAVTTLVNSNTLVQTLAQANAAGYSISNQYAPTSASSPTVGQGLNLSNYFTTDLLGNPRPPSGPWDIGAYQFQSGAPTSNPTATPIPTPTPTPTATPVPTPTATPSGIAFVQVASSDPQSSATSVSAAFPIVQEAGDLNVVLIGWNTTGSPISSVTDSEGNLYVLATGPVALTDLGAQSIYYAKNIKSGPNTITVTFSSATPYADLRVLEYSGLDTSNPFDVGSGSTGTSTISSSDSITTTSVSEILVAGNYVVSYTSSAGNGFTSRVFTAPNGSIAEDGIVSSAGSYVATADLTQSAPWIMQVAAFKAAAVAPTPTPVPTPVPSPTPAPTYNAWEAQLKAEIAVGVTPAQLLEWINANPPSQD